MRRTPRNRRQFSLRGLLVFVAVFSVWLSQIPAHPFTGCSDAGLSWKQLGLVFFAWLVLAVYYAAARLTIPLGLQIALPAIHAVGIAGCLLVGRNWISPAFGARIDWQEALWLMWLNCYAVSAVSFPLAVLSLLGSFVRRRTRGK